MHRNESPTAWRTSCCSISETPAGRLRLGRTLYRDPGGVSNLCAQLDDPHLHDGHELIFHLNQQDGLVDMGAVGRVAATRHPPVNHLQGGRGPQGERWSRNRKWGGFYSEDSRAPPCPLWGSSPSSRSAPPSASGPRRATAAPSSWTGGCSPEPESHLRSGGGGAFMSDGAANATPSRRDGLGLHTCTL